MSNKDFILVKNFINSETITEYLKMTKNKNAHDSKVGNRVCDKKKIRKDIFFNTEESYKIDKTVFAQTKLISKEAFDVVLDYRERYKIGTYYGDASQGGFYVPHMDTQGPKNVAPHHRKISIVICLSNRNDYTGGVFHLVNLKKKFKFDKGDAIMFDSNLLHGVEPVVSGKRLVLISFMWGSDGEIIRQSRFSSNSMLYTPFIDNNYSEKIINKMTIINSKKYISFIPGDGGPGNQIIGIKECLILAILLNRICIIPSIREHYTKSNKIFYNFDDIFKLNLNDIVIDNNKGGIINTFIVDKIYSIHSRYFNKRLRHEDIITHKAQEVLLKKRVIHNEQNLTELRNVNEGILIIKHLFNNISINKCTINGCFKCDINTNFEKIYEEICSKFDFSDYIKDIGNNYIKNIFQNTTYISLHIRLPDILGTKTIDQYTNNIYSNEKICEIIKNIQKKNRKPLFIASNNIRYLEQLNLNCYFYDDDKNKYNSFVEQYICCESDSFYYLCLENTRFFNTHYRSTWTSFVIDYRNYLNKKNNNINLRDKTD